MGKALWLHLILVILNGLSGFRTAIEGGKRKWKGNHLIFRFSLSRFIFANAGMLLFSQMFLIIKSVLTTPHQSWGFPHEKSGKKD